MIDDIPSAIHHLSFQEVIDKAGEFHKTVYVFQSEEINSEWNGFFQPDSDRFRMGPGTGLISVDKIHQQGTSLLHVNFYNINSQCVWELGTSIECNHSFTQSFGDDSVAILTDNGIYLKYQHCQLIKKWNIGLSSIDSVMNASLWNDGFAAILTNGDLICSTDLQSYHVLKHFDSIGCPSQFDAIPPKKPKTENVIVYFIYEDKLYVISQNTKYILSLNEKIINFSFSFHYSKIAIFTDDSNLNDPSVQPTYKVIVSSIDLKNVIYTKTVQNGNYNRVINIGWVGDVAPIACFQGAFFFVTPDTSDMLMCKLNDQFDDSYCLTDVDSCVILTSGLNYRIRHVPLNVYYIFSESETRPDIPIVYRELENTLSLSADQNGKWNYARLLCLAYDERNETPPITSLGKIGTDDLKKSAANDCLLAATYFHDPKIQEFFLNAACYVLTSMKQTALTTLMVDPLLRIKILNKVRNEAKLPMTTQQIYHIGITDLLNKLMSRGRATVASQGPNDHSINYHDVAFQIARLLRRRTDDIQRDFIEKTISTNSDDDSCYETIKSNIDSKGSMTGYGLNSDCGYQFAVRYAISQEKYDLASRLCLLEKQYSNRSEIFAQLGQWDQAIKYAYGSFDLNALITVLDYCYKVDNEADVMKINKTLALFETPSIFLANYPTFMGIERTLTILDQVDPKSNFCDVKQRAIINISKMPDIVADKDDEIPLSLQTALEPQNKLREYQKDIAASKNNPEILKMTYNDTIRYLINNSDPEMALQLATDTGNQRINVAVLAIHEYIKNRKYYQLKSFVLVKEFSSIWPLVIDLSIQNGNEQFAREFAEEVSAKFKDPLLLKQIDENKFDIKALHSKDSYQKYFFRQKTFVHKFIH